jgi:MFS family permease
MVLYAKALGASATVLGIIAGMMPLLVISQIPAAQHVARVGFRRFVYAGWGTRVLFIFVMALVPVTDRFLNPTTRLALILTLLFGFNLSRGISSAAWLPWITSLVPASVRGNYLARDAACVNLGSAVSFLIAAGCLGHAPAAWQFALLFSFSAVMGALSLVFLKRIPEVATPEQVRTSNTPVPYWEIARYAPFRKLLKMVLAWSVAYGGLATFTVAFLKTEAGMPEGRILLLNSVLFLGGLCSLWFLGPRLDTLGSKPVLRFGIITWLLIVAGWALVAGKVMASSISLVLALQFLMGLFAALVTMSNTRLAMAIIPVMGRNHFFALFSVVGSVALGLAPILWGLLIDVIGPWRVSSLGIEWNRFSIFFAAAAAVFAVTLFLVHELEEPQAASMETLLREILIQSPQRVWVRLWPRP